MTKRHQTQVLTYLKTDKTLSQTGAIHHFDCYQLSALIRRLRITGHNIVKNNESNLNGKGANACYELNEVQA